MLGRRSRSASALVALFIVVALGLPSFFALAHDGRAIVSGKRLVKRSGRVISSTVRPIGDSDRDRDRVLVGELDVWTDPGEPSDGEGVAPPPQIPPVEPPVEPPEPSEPTPPEDPPAECDGIDVAAGANVAAAVRSAPPGATICLAAGTFRTGQTIALKSGQSLIGAGRDRTFITTSSAPAVISAKGTTGVTLRGFDVSGAQGSRGCRPMCGRGISPGRQTVISDIRSHNNETSGIGGGGEQTVVRDVELDHNGSFELLGCCAAGIKAGNSYSISDSYVHDNIGVGIWCDVGCKGGSFSVVNNVVTGNLRGGIRYEISAVPAVIRSNTVRNNNTSDRGGHGGIEINSARNALVEGNVLGGNKRAGILLNGNRPPGVANVTVRGNVLNGDGLKGCSTRSARCHGNSG